MEITIGKARHGQHTDPLPGQVYVGRPSRSAIPSSSAAMASALR
jgi:IMP cyclohydrolase